MNIIETEKDLQKTQIKLGLFFIIPTIIIAAIFIYTVTNSLNAIADKLVNSQNLTCDSVNCKITNFNRKKEILSEQLILKENIGSFEFGFETIYPSRRPSYEVYKVKIIDKNLELEKYPYKRHTVDYKIATIGEIGHNRDSEYIKTLVKSLNYKLKNNQDINVTIQFN